MAKGSRAGWIAFGIALTLFFGYSLLNDREARQQVQVMRTELESLPTPKAVAPMSCSDIWKPGQALYGCRYRGRVELKEVLLHYRTELQSRGWTDEAFNPMTNSSSWTKGPYVATLHWQSGELTPTDWDFALELKWRGVSSTP